MLSVNSRYTNIVGPRSASLAVFGGEGMGLGRGIFLYRETGKGPQLSEKGNGVCYRYFSRYRHGDCFFLPRFFFLTPRCPSSPGALHLPTPGLHRPSTVPHSPTSTTDHHCKPRAREYTAPCSAYIIGVSRSRAHYTLHTVHGRAHHTYPNKRAQYTKCF